MDVNTNWSWNMSFISICVLFSIIFYVINLVYFIITLHLLSCSISLHIQPIHCMNMNVCFIVWSTACLRQLHFINCLSHTVTFYQLLVSDSYILSKAVLYTGLCVCLCILSSFDCVLNCWSRVVSMVGWLASLDWLTTHEVLLVNFQ